MEITFLGTSSAVHSKKRNHPAIALRAFGEVMLFDCGESTQKQIMFANISPMKISKIFLTHYHGDHVLGLPGLLQSLNFRGRKKTLQIYGPKGLKQIKRAIEILNFHDFNFPIEYIEVENGVIVETEEYIIKAQSVKHNTPTVAYSIEEKKKPKFLREKAIELGVPVGPLFGKLHNGEEVIVNGKIIKPSDVLGETKKGRKITYSGDTMPCEEIVSFAKGSNLLIYESTYSIEDKDKADENAHSTSKDAAEIAKASDVDNLILTHISTRYKNADKILKEAKTYFKNSKIAYDLLTIKI